MAMAMAKAPKNSALRLMQRTLLEMRKPLK